MKSINRFNKKGERNGLWHNYFDMDENAKFPKRRLSSSGNYKNGLKQGLWNFYYSTGTISTTGSYINGLQSGIWNFFNTDGSLTNQKIHII